MWRLVSTPSVTGNEGALARLVGQELQSLGFQVEYQVIEGERCNVLGTLGHPRAGRTLLFATHLDTAAPASDWKVDPFRPLAKGGRLYGLGACDAKGGMAAMLAACRTVDPGRLKGCLMFSAFADEEAYSTGAHLFLRRGFPVDFCVLAEPHFRQVVIGCQGKILLRVAVKGKAAHASSPQLGINVINDLARIVTELDRMPVTRHERMGAGSLCPLQVSAGTERYSLVVPESGVLLVNKHIVPGEEDFAASFRRRIDSLGLPSAVTVTVDKPYYPPYEISTEQEVFQAVATAFREVTGEEVEPVYNNSVCDANLLVSAGIPTVVFGPSGGNMHSAGEWVEMEEVIAAAAVYRRVVSLLLE